MSFIDKILDKIEFKLLRTMRSSITRIITSMMRKKKSFQEILSAEKKRLLKRNRP